MTQTDDRWQVVPAGDGTSSSYRLEYRWLADGDLPAETGWREAGAFDTLEAAYQAAEEWDGPEADGMLVEQRVIVTETTVTTRVLPYPPEEEASS